MSNVLPVVIISAPQGSNKTSHANALANRFGCTRIVEEWDGVSDLQPGDLALTNIPVADLACVAEEGA